jgi:hypothetical protein
VRGVFDTTPVKNEKSPGSPGLFSYRGDRI